MIFLDTKELIFICRKTDIALAYTPDVPKPAQLICFEIFPLNELSAFFGVNQVCLVAYIEKTEGACDWARSIPLVE